MRAVRFHETGPVDVLRLEEVPRPEPGPGEALVRVRACGVNRLDIYARTGRTPVPLPHVSGSEVAGEVAALGPGVAGLEVGQPVAVHPYLHDGTCEFCLRGEEPVCLRGDILGLKSDGGFADFVLVPGNSLVPLPPGLSFRSAAAVTLAALTAYRMLVNRARVRPGEDVLVWGASSGVGSAAVQLAKLLGARVIATASGADRLAKARELGADEVIDHYTQDVAGEVRRITGKRGVDVVVEHVGQATWSASVAALARNGRLVSCGATSGNEGSLNLWVFFAKQLQFIGSYGGNRAELTDVLKLVARGDLKPVIDRTLPLEAVAEAQRLLEQSRQFGKVIVEP